MEGQFDYQERDYVLLFQPDNNKHVYGKIQELKPDQDTFYYTLCFQPNDLPEPYKNQAHFGQYELILTDQNYSEKISNIQEKANVITLSEYIKKEIYNPHDQKSTLYYVQRVVFETSTQKFIPDLNLSYECFCGNIINPDNTLIQCTKCESKFYHYNCLKSDTKCLNCGQELQKNMFSSDIELKRTRQQVELNPNIKSEISEQKEEDNEPDAKPVQKKSKIVKSEALDKILEQINADEEDDEPIEIATKINKQNSKKLQVKKENTHNNLQKTASTSSQGKSKQQFSNISQDQINQMTILVDRYRQSSCTSRLNGIDKKRHEVKERLIKQIIYGVMEMKNKKQMEESQLKQLFKPHSTPQQLDEQRERFIKKFNEIQQYDQNELYDFARKTAISIELTLFKTYNATEKFLLTQQYKDRFRLINLHMIDDENYILRLKVILECITVQQLITCKEYELYNPKKKMEMNKLKQKEIDSTQSNDTGFTIIKTNKADIEVINDNNQIEEERQKRLEQQEEQIRIYKQKNLERQRMLQNQKREFKYNDFLNVNFNTEKLELFKNRLENVDQKQIDCELFQSIITLTGGNGKNRMLKRIKEELSDKHNKELIEELENY